MSKTRRQKVSARKRAETHKSGIDFTTLSIPEGVKLFKINSEKTRRIDIISFRAGKGNPHAEEGELYFERTYYMHRNVGPDGDSYICLAKTCKQPCPICEYRAKLAKDPDADEQQIKDLAPKERQLWNVIDVDNREAGIQLWDISYHLFGKLLDAEVNNADEDENFEFFADPVEGYTLKLGVQEKSFGGQTFYEVQTIGFKERAEQYDEDIVDEANCLDELLKITPYEKLKAIFLQTEVQDEDEEDEPKQRSKKKEKIVEEDDDEREEQVEKESQFEEGDVVYHKKHGHVEIIRINSRADMAVVELKDGEEVKVALDELSKSQPKQKSVRDQDDEPKLKKKVKPVDDDEVIPKKKKKVVDDEEEEPTLRKSKSKKPKQVEVDDDDQEEWDPWGDEDDD